MEVIVLDNQGVIETFNDEDTAIDSLDRIRQDNQDIKGDLIVAKVIHKEK